MHVYDCYGILYVEDEGIMAAEQRMLGAEVLRLNLSEVYQSLNAESILREMVERKLIQPNRKKDAETFSSKYAQNISTGVALFYRESSPTVMLDLCKVLEARECPKQRILAMKLREGMMIICRNKLSMYS